MKKIFLLLAVVGMTVFQGCEGDEGPAGPAGPESEVFEVSNVDFNPNADPDLAYRVFFDLNPDIYASDNVLIYELAGVEGGFDVWKLLPQVYTFGGVGTGAIMQYNYDFTLTDFSIFIDANFDRSTLDASWTQNRVFRIVIVPGYFSGKSAVDVKDYDAVIKAYKIDDSKVVKLQQKAGK